MKKYMIMALVIAAMASEPALAYTGPGLGAATIAVVVGFFTSIFVALFAVIWYPIKRLLKNRKKTQAAGAVAKVDAVVKADDSATPSNATDPKEDASASTAE